MRSPSRRVVRALSGVKVPVAGKELIRPLATQEDLDPALASQLRDPEHRHRAGMQHRHLEVSHAPDEICPPRVRSEGDDVEVYAEVLSDGAGKLELIVLPLVGNRRRESGYPRLGVGGKGGDDAGVHAA